MKLRVLFALLLVSVAIGAQEKVAAPASSGTATPSLQNTPEISPGAEVANKAKLRPRIGLVLEGGGALGLAHVGVLKWFEEHHIPIDYVAGTSMGGLVGGLYATGRSSDEIHAFLRDINWYSALNSDVPYKDLAFRRKEDAREYPATLEFGFKDRAAVLPSGFNSGHEVGLILDRIAYPYTELRSFDELPTPFRCVSTDLVSGKAVVFDQGSLSEALRATMSLPAIFSPVRRNGQVLVDGGLLENLPVDVARRMGADIVIAVNLQTKPLNPSEPLSALGVLQRSISIGISVNELESMRRADLVIQVHTQEFTSVDYQAAEKIIDLGFAGSEERNAVLSRFALSDGEWAVYAAERNRRAVRPPVPEFIEVSGADANITQALEKTLTSDVGQPLNFERIDKQLTEITGIGRFSRAGYQLIHKDGKPGLLIRADQKEYGSPLVKPLVLLDGSDYNNVRLSVGARLTFFDLGGFGAEWRNDVIVGSDYGISSEYYRPLDRPGHFFLAPRLFANNTPFDIYDGDQRVASYRERNLGGGFDAGIAFDRSSELRVGYQLENLRLTRNIGTAEFPDVGGRQGVMRLLYRVDRTDDRSVPRRGYRLETSFRYFDTNPLASEGFPVAEVRSAFFHRLNRPSSVFFTASGGSTFGYHDVGVPPFSLGGPLRLSAYGNNTFLTSQYFLFQAGYIRRLRQLTPLLGRNLYLIGNYEIGKAYFGPYASALPMDGNVGILIQTFLGPVVFGGAVGDRGHSKFYFKIGRYF
jgi:NTE family protein